MKKITEQNQVFVIKLQMLYDVEQELEKSLPKLVKSASEAELVTTFSSHLEETKEHTKRLEKIFEMLGETPTKFRSEAIRSIEEDTNVVSKINSSTQLKDTMLASSARFAEHYEMAGYMSAIAEAKQLGLEQIAEILEETLKEEELADKKLEASILRNFQSEIV